MKKIDQYKCGDVAKIVHTITEEDVLKFAELTGDDNPLHVNRSFAQKTVFKDIVAHGMLGASYLSTLIGKHIPGDGALWISQSFEFLLPVRIGDVLCIEACVLEAHVSQNLLVLDTKITNQYKQTVVTGIGKVKLLEIERPENEIEKCPDDKVIVIIGASRGIGAATAEYLAKMGYKVCINYSKDKSGAQSVLRNIKEQGGDGIIFQADVTQVDAVNAMFDKIISHFGNLTGLVYGATSKIVAADFLDLSYQDVENHFNLQIQGAFHCTQRVVKEFIERKNGSVVYIGSLYADAPALKLTGYSASKAALHSMSKSLALEYGPYGIRFNVVSPGMTETSLIADVPEKTRLLTKMKTPLRRLAQPIDIANAIEFLLSPKSSQITGETLRIYGGQLML